MSGIGVLNEKPLHAALKQWYARPGDRFEVAVDGFVIDIVRGDRLIEIQTGNFFSIKPKLTALVRSHQVRLVYPIAQERWIVQTGPGHPRRALRRKSPKRGRWEELFRELVSIPQLLTNPNFSVEVLLIREEETRRFAGRRQWRWAIDARRLLDVIGHRVFEAADDWRHCLPAALESFTAKDLAAAMNTRTDLAQKMAYCLTKGRVIELVGRRGRANLYRVPNPPDPQLAIIGTCGVISYNRPSSSENTP
jgi:hypothetical protein